MTPPTNPGRPADVSIGTVLRQARSDRGLSLSELQARTKVHVRYLAALEEERFQDLPPYPFTRGFLQLAAQELGLDPGPLLRRLGSVMSAAAEPSVDGWRRLDGAITPAVLPSRARRIALTAGALTALAVAVLAVFFMQQLRELSEPAPVATPAPTVTPATPAAGPGPAAAPDGAPTPAASSTPAAAASPGVVTPAAGGVMIEVRATGRSWLLVVADDRTVFEGFVDAGQTRTWEARTAIRIRAGNAGAVALVADGNVISPLGLPGEVVDRTFSRNERR